MNSEQTQAYLNRARQAADIPPVAVSILDKSIACYLDIFALSVNARSEPAPDLLGLSASLLLLSNAANELDEGLTRDSVDYLVAMGFEQSGELLSRAYGELSNPQETPINNDHWYRLTLALLHYLAGGFRVQGYSVVQKLKTISDHTENELRESYRQAYSALRRLYSARTVNLPVDEWEMLLFSQQVPTRKPETRIHLLARRIQQRRQATLVELGEGQETEWLRRREIGGNEAVTFWRNYLARLDDRGVTSFTEEQRGQEQGFETWLHLSRDLLVSLPTGSGKTMIGELKTALTLAVNKQVVWILPTRSLVRQTRHYLASSFRNLGVTVEELPTTEDFQPLFADQMAGGKYIAVTTPEKLAALIRTRPESVANIGLVVLDEAQNLFDIHRGATFEYVIQSLKNNAANSSFVFMSAMADSIDRLRLFMDRLRGDGVIRDEKISDNRPTRRINGVLTTDEHNKPVILCYPPGPQIVDDQTLRPLSIHFDKIRPTINNTPLVVSLKILKQLTESKLKTALFVEQKRSTTNQARAVAKVTSTISNLPAEDVDRITTELGRESVVIEFGAKGVSPHHAGLSPVEQHIIEKWIKEGHVRTVIATPTLAQGVNLPFDISIISFLRRYDQQTNTRQDLSQAEILNMLGRAGRAGYVSDGICLIATQREIETPVSVLDRHRRYYFSRQEVTTNFLGLSRLMIRGYNSNVGEPDWLNEMGNMGFSEAKDLISFSVRAALSDLALRESLTNRLLEFPSIQDLREYFGAGFDVLNLLAQTLEPLVENVRAECGDDVGLLDALMRTGMPIQILRRYFDVLRGENDWQRLESSERMIWADQVVFDTLAECSDRAWYQGVFDEGRMDMQALRNTIVQWRSGAQIREIEQDWQYRPRAAANQIAIGEFLNHKIALLAQFWGALSVCEEIVSPLPAERFLENIQLYVREGVSSIAQFVWLKRTGGIDRVLAHSLSQETPADMDRAQLRLFVDRQLNAWRANPATIPQEISNEKIGALTSILRE
ncbi:MAG: DEAD/DEAH box helicase [Anaerolineales bacterium]|nr:DEAD/DEAH box helicase [Anaerolineales bacterium]